MVTLAASIGALFVGPALFRMASGGRIAMSVLDGFVLVTIGGLVLLDFLPHSVLLAGRWALLAAGIGLVIPGLAERVVIEGTSARMGGVFLGLALLGLVVHDFLDGAVVAGHADPDHDPENLLALGVILHRIPVGLAIWGLVRPSQGVGRALGLLVLISAATLAGAAMSEATLGTLAGQGLAVMQALVAGSLLHVVSHALPLGEECEGEHPTAAALGALLGGILLLGLAALHPVVHQIAGELGAGQTFLTLALTAAPPLVLALLLGALIHVLVPPPPLAWLSQTPSPFVGLLRGLLLGVPLAFSQTARPTLHRWVMGTDVPPGPAVTLLSSAPGSVISGLLLSCVFFDARLVALRLASFLLFALATGWVVSRMTARPPAKVETEIARWPKVALSQDLLPKALQFAARPMVERTAPWTLLGLAAAAILEPSMSPDLLRNHSTLLIPLMAFAGLPAHLAATGAIPLIAVLMHKGLSPGAAIAFLLTGPAAHLHTLRAVAATHGKRTAVALGGTALMLASGLGALVDLGLPDATEWSLHAQSAQTPGLLGVICLSLLSTLTMAALLEHGPRKLLVQLGVAHAHEHDHAEARPVPETQARDTAPWSSQ